MELQKAELLQIYGGINLSGTLINSLIRGINAILDLGRSIGTAFRRIGGKKICPLS